MEEVPIILQFNKNSGDFKRQANGFFLSNPKMDLPLINSSAGYMTMENIYRIVENPEIDYISFDSRVFTLLDIATATMEANLPHNRGYNGRDVTIAVVDTGVSPHNDLTLPHNRIVGFRDFVNNRRETYDDNGHGSHVAGIIAGNGYSSYGKYAGIAPGANILSIKVLGSNGETNTSNLIGAIDYVIATRKKYNTRIINLSLGTSANTNCDKDPLCRAVSLALDMGLIVVAAAGNSGPEPSTILSPGISRDVITVGAVDDKRTPEPHDDTIAPFSSRGPVALDYNKPDIVAPGVNIHSLSNTRRDGYSSLSGTSMATPLVSGSIALILNKYPNIKAKDVKAKLLESCIDLKEGKNSQGAGLLNLKLLFKNSWPMV